MLQHGSPCLAFGQRARIHTGTMYGHCFFFSFFFFLEASNVKFSMVFDIVNQSKRNEPYVVGVCNLVVMKMWLWI